MAASGAALGRRRPPLKDKGEGSNSKRGWVQQPKYHCVMKIALESGKSPLKGKGEGSNKQPKYRCVVKIALESRKSPLKGKGEGLGSGVQQIFRVNI